jgi:nitroreductase
MDARDAIFTRRSVREFTGEAVSAGNQQPWQFVVVRERALLDEIARVHPYAQMCRTVSTAILVCGDASLEKFPGYWVQDCSAATQNILLMAHARGYGASWVGIHPRPERIAAVRGLLRLPENVHPLCLVPVGRPSAPLPVVDRYQPTRVHRDRWA